MKNFKFVSIVYLSMMVEVCSVFASTDDHIGKNAIQTLPLPTSSVMRGVADIVQDSIGLARDSIGLAGALVVISTIIPSIQKIIHNHAIHEHQQREAAAKALSIEIAEGARAAQKSNFGYMCVPYPNKPGEEIRVPYQIEIVEASYGTDQVREDANAIRNVIQRCQNSFKGYRIHECEFDVKNAVVAVNMAGKVEDPIREKKYLTVAYKCGERKQDAWAPEGQKINLSCKNVINTYF